MYWRISLLFWYGLFALGYLLDRFLKRFFFYHPDSWYFFPSQESALFSFHLSLNPGIAFNIHLPPLILITAVIFVSIVLCIFFVRSINEERRRRALGILLVILGAVSNIADRILYGQVVDYIDVPFFTLLNLADVMISLGVGIVIFDEYFSQSWKRAS